MDVIEMARELGKAIQQDERYKRIDAAKKANDEDSQLQEPSLSVRRLCRKRSGRSTTPSSTRC